MNIRSFDYTTELKNKMGHYKSRKRKLNYSLSLNGNKYVDCYFYSCKKMKEKLDFNY